MATQPFDSATTTAANRSEVRQVDWLEAIWAPRVLSIMRMVTGLIFMEHGTQKWLNFPPLGRPAPEFLSMSGFGGMLELVGGVAGARPFHAPRCIHPVRRNGNRLLVGACAAGFLSGAQWRRCCDPVLLHFPLSRVCGWRRMEPGSRAAAQGLTLSIVIDPDGFRIVLERRAHCPQMVTLRSKRIHNQGTSSGHLTPCTTRRS